MTNGIIASGDLFCSLDEVRTQAGQAARGMISRAPKGTRVALLMRNGIDFVTAAEATRMAGRVPVPINWHFTASEVAYVMNDCGADVLIAHADILHSLGDALLSQLAFGTSVVWVSTPAEMITAFRIPSDRRDPPDGATTWTDLCTGAIKDMPAPGPAAQPVIYTSGTTGHPKGVLRLGPAVAPSAHGTDAFFTPEVRTLLSAPLYHAAPNRFAHLTLRADGVLVLSSRFDAEQTLSLIEKWQINTTFLVPTMMRRILQLPIAVRDRYDTSSLRHVVTAGAPCPPDVKRRLIDLWGPVIYEFYGSTETGAVTHCTSEDALARPGTVGRAMPNARLAILDDTGQPCPPDATGEIYGVRLDYHEFTYLNRPEARDEVVRDGLITGGDIGYLDKDGYLFINDRKRDMIISGGVNIYPAHVEAALLEHEKVVDCAVFGIPDTDLGEQVAVIYETHPDDPADEAALANHLAQRIAKYMLPRLYVRTETLPRDPSGKVQKRRLRAPYWEGIDRAI